MTVALAKWVKIKLYCAMTGHSIDSLKELRRGGSLIEGLHYKLAPGSERIYLFNHAEIDKFIDKARVIL